MISCQNQFGTCNTERNVDKKFPHATRFCGCVILNFGTQEYSCLFDKNCKVCDNHVPDIRRIPDDVPFVGAGR